MQFEKVFLHIEDGINGTAVIKNFIQVRRRCHIKAEMFLIHQLFVFYTPAAATVVAHLCQCVVWNIYRPMRYQIDESTDSQTDKKVTR